MSSEELIAPLLSPLQIRGARLPNRILMSPMGKAGASDGVPGEKLATYYRRRAEAGVGTIYTGMLYVNHDGTADGFGSGEGTIPHMWGDEALEGWRRLVEGIHAAGGLIFPQLGHIGAMLETGKDPDRVSYTPSGTWGPTDRITSYSKEAVANFSKPGRAMTEQDIQDVINAFAESAANAKSVGFDGIAIHGGHGYLIDNFLWEGTNLRDDDWGGDHVGRTRFAVEIIRAVRSAIGEDMPISFRFSQWKPQDFETRLAETPQQLEEILGPLADAGVDIFEASARDFSEPAFADLPENLSYWARKITGKTTVMFGGTGVYREKHQSTMTPPKTINNLDDIMHRYNHGDFDLLAVGRSLLNDPLWLEKVRSGTEFLPFNPGCLSLDYLE